MPFDLFFLLPNYRANTQMLPAVYNVPAGMIPCSISDGVGNSAVGVRFSTPKALFSGFFRCCHPRQTRSWLKQCEKSSF